MPLITFPNTFVAGTRAKASEVNANFAIVNTWLSAGSIEATYLATLSSALTWNISTAAKALSITNSGSEGDISVTRSGILSASKAGVKFANSVAQTLGDAEIYLDSTHASSTIPQLLLRNSGTGDFLRVDDTAQKWKLKKGTNAFKYDVDSASYSHIFQVNNVDKVTISSAGLDGAGVATNTLPGSRILDNSITLQKMGAASVNSTVIMDGSVFNNNLANDSVTTTKLFDGAVTQAKLGASNYNTQTPINDTVTNVANYTVNAVNLTAIGTRPILIGVTPSGTSTGNIIFVRNAVWSGSIDLALTVGAVEVYTWRYNTAVDGDITGTTKLMLPMPVAFHVPTAGLHTISLKVSASDMSAGTKEIRFRNIQLFAVQL